MIDATAIGSVTLVFAFTILMATQLSFPVWKLIHPLQETQFPWRWLAVTSLAGSLLVGACLPFWRGQAQGKKRPLVPRLRGSNVFPCVSLSHTIRRGEILSARDFESLCNRFRGSASVTQWLPIWTSDRVRTMQSNVETDGRSVTVDSWEPERRTFHVAAGGPTFARVKTFYYPHGRRRLGVGICLRLCR